MRAHATTDTSSRTKAFQEHRQELQGRLPKGPFELFADLTFDDIEVSDDDPPVVKRLKLATRRDMRYGVASSVYLSVFGLSQSLRSIYDGGGQIQDGGGA